MNKKNLPNKKFTIRRAAKIMTEEQEKANIDRIKEHLTRLNSGKKINKMGGTKLT